MEKKKVRILAIQMESAIGDLDLNIDTVRKLLQANLEKYGSTDFVFLPEVWTVGWHPQLFQQCAESLKDSKAVKMLQYMAKKYSTNIIGGSIIRVDNGKYYNSCPIVLRNGDVAGVYDKNHLFSYYGCDEGSFIQRGLTPVLADIEGVKLGLTICYDIRFPEIFREYRKAGADILVNMAAWGKSKKIPWDSMTTSRAVENQSYMVALTQTGMLMDGTENLGHSMIIDYEGKVLDEINEIEGGIYAEIDLTKMYLFREKCTILNDIKENYKVTVV